MSSEVEFPSAAALGLPVGLAAQRPPTNVTVLDTKGSITVSWDGIRDKVTYRVLRSPDLKEPGQDLTRPLPYTVTSFLDAGVAPGTEYVYRVIVGGLNGDNWDITNVQLFAVGGGLSPNGLISNTLRPYRFTGARIPLIVDVR